MGVQKHSLEHMTALKYTRFALSTKHYPIWIYNNRYIITDILSAQNANKSVNLFSNLSFSTLYKFQPRCYEETVYIKFRLICWVNDLPQCLQAYGFSPV